jgi:hypothetical protein
MGDGGVDRAGGARPGPAVGGGVAGQFVTRAANGAIGSAISQGIGVATGLQKQFSWVGVATAGIEDGVRGIVGPQLGADPQGQFGDTLAGFGGDALTGAASLLAGAAARSLISGTDFGNSVQDELPSVVSQTLESLVSQGEIENGQSQASQDNAAAVQDIAASADQREAPLVPISTSNGEVEVPSSQINLSVSQVGDLAGLGQFEQSWNAQSAALGQTIGDMLGSSIDQKLNPTPQTASAPSATDAAVDAGSSGGLSLTNSKFLQAAMPALDNGNPVSFSTGGDVPVDVEVGEVGVARLEPVGSGC